MKLEHMKMTFYYCCCCCFYVTEMFVSQKSVILSPQSQNLTSLPPPLCASALQLHTCFPLHELLPHSCHSRSSTKAIPCWEPSPPALTSALSTANIILFAAVFSTSPRILKTRYMQPRVTQENSLSCEWKQWTPFFTKKKEKKKL